VEQVVCCKLTDVQMKLYKSFISSKSICNELSKSDKVGVSSLSSITQLKKLCNRKYKFTLNVLNKERDDESKFLKMATFYLPFQTQASFMINV